MHLYDETGHQPVHGRLSQLLSVHTVIHTPTTQPMNTSETKLNKLKTFLLI